METSLAQLFSSLWNPIRSSVQNLAAVFQSPSGRLTQNKPPFQQMTPSTSPFSGQEALVPGTLIGYRYWSLVAPSAILRTVVKWPNKHSASHPYDLTTRLATHQAWLRDKAYCTKGFGHAVPFADCTCGYYGLYWPDKDRLQAAQITNANLFNIFGAFEASGRIILGENGFRAGEVRPVAVFIPKYGMNDLNLHLDSNEIARANSIKVYDTVSALLEAYPPADLSTFGITIPEVDYDMIRYLTRRLLHEQLRDKSHKFMARKGSTSLPASTITFHQHNSTVRKVGGTTASGTNFVQWK